MNVLIVGNGGREHALLWKMRRDDPAARFYVTRPNGGMLDDCVAVDLAPTDVEGIAAWAASHRPDLTVVGPEAPLAAGLVDRLQREGLPAFGPTASAARIESSKAYAKDLMTRAGVPTAHYRAFRDRDAAIAWVEARGAPIVVKASGLAAGKGAVVCASVAEAIGAVTEMVDGTAFGAAGHEVVIEECMEGPELSVFAICDGRHAALLLPAQDHKRVGEGDTGPNTGGMGAYAPVSMATPDVIAEARGRVIEPTLAALAADGAPFRGLLYAGLMSTSEGLKVVEFNCRFGDPETQALLPLMSSSLLQLMADVASGGSVEDATIEWSGQRAVTTVVASGGYPGSYERGRPITIPAGLEDDGLILFHAGTSVRDGALVSSGGRVLAATGLGTTVEDAAARSRKGAASIDLEGSFFRSDIGWRETASDSHDQGQTP